MKTKLLRKIRKRYEIIRIDNLGDTPWEYTDMYYKYRTGKELNNGDYILNYKHKIFGFITWRIVTQSHFNTLDRCKRYMLNQVEANYIDIVRGRDITKVTKVWYNG